MYTHKVSSPKYIDKWINNRPKHSKIKNLTLQVEDIDAFLLDLLPDIKDDPEWPLAVPMWSIVDKNSEKDLENRALGIVEEHIDQEVFGFSFLDFGCGGGHVASEVQKKGARTTVGYDKAIDEHWNLLKKDNLVLTDDWDKVVSLSPYDYILAYDVFDHILDEDVSEKLKVLSSLLSQDGRISIRFHPWISRHGAHLYNQINKAFIHLLYNEEQLQEMGFAPEKVHKVIHPMWSYKGWIEKAGLKVQKENKVLEPVEDFFLKNDIFRSKINLLFRDSPLKEYKEGKGDLARVMSFHFVDFVLTK